MKTLKIKIAIALLATTVFFNANAEDKKSGTSQASSSMLDYKGSNLNIGMYEFGKANSMKLSMSLTKDAGKMAIVKIMDEQGSVLNE